MYGINRLLALYIHEMIYLSLHCFLRSIELRTFCVEVRNGNLVAEIVLNCIRKNEIAIGETLHKSRSSKTVSSVFREVTFSDCKQTGKICLQLVVNPKTAHCVVNGGINHHRVVIFHTVYFLYKFSRVNVRDFFVHVKEVSVTLKNNVETETADCFGEVKINGKTGIVYTETCITTLFSST